MSLLVADAVRREYVLPHDRLGRAPRKAALHGVDLLIPTDRSVAIIGESGSGKSTLLRILLGLDRASGGRVSWDGREIRPGRSAGLAWLRRRTGVVLQDPYASLDPRRTVGASVAEPLRALRVPGDHHRLVHDVLERVGLHAWRAEQFPHQLSGGQRQRVALARALVHGPELLVGDEPLSALDVTIRAQVLELLADLHRTRGTGLLLVSHDIGLVRQVADEVVVLHEGRVVDHGPTDRVLAAPTSDYTRTLLAAVPRMPAAGSAPPG